MYIVNVIVCFLEIDKARQVSYFSKLVEAKYFNM